MNPRAVEARVLAVAPWLLGLSLLGQLTMVAFQTQMTMIDLMVYRNGSPEIFTGLLYDWRLSEFSDKFALPFTYPPFSAFVFLPLSWIPWGVARWFWQILCLACLFWMIRTALKMIDAEHLSRRAMLWTALAIWVEPVRTTLNYGQINLLLAAVLLATMASSRPWVAGFGVGLTAGIKLTPAVSGVYFLGTKRFAAAIWSVVAFGLTVGFGFLIAPQLSKEYWFHLLGDATRIGPVGSSINQSLRGALSRTVGYDVQSGPIYLAGVLVAVVLMVWALREALRAKQTLAAIVVVQVFGLLVSPISWSHHWVWALPALMWLLYGPANRHRLVNATSIVWVVSIGSFLISFLLIWQDSIWTIPRPWWESLLGWVYPAAGLLTLVAIAVGLRALGGSPQTESVSSPESEPQPADQR